MTRGISNVFITLLLIIISVSGCVQKSGDRSDQVTIVFKHGKIAGDPQQFQQFLDRFEKENPGIKVRDEVLPASTDEQHQFYAINLEGESSDFDVLSMDVIWVPEFASAGWLRDISHLLREGEGEEFFTGPMKAVTYLDRQYAIPWYIDAGLLYYRKDLLEKYGFSPPETWQELVMISKQIMQKEPDLYGFIWQGKQYEGLVCNVLEYFWSNGGDVLTPDGMSVINSPSNIEAIKFMRDMISEHRISPSLVTTSIEEPTRHLFGSGKALFMRNWPYAWNIFEKEGSPVRGKTGVSVLPSFPGKDSASTLGGWQLGVNRYSRHPEAAEKLVAFFTSQEIQKEMALSIGYKPTRRSLYQDKELLEGQPFMSSLYSVFMRARPRPVSPYYMMISQVMQPEFSAALSGIRTPEEALHSAHKQITHILQSKR